MLELLGRAGCVSIEAGVESISEEGRALLAAFGVAGEFRTRLGSSTPAPAVSAAQVAAIFEGAPAELD